MTVMLVCMIPLSGLIGFIAGAMLSMASEADRQCESDLASLKGNRDRKEEG